MSDQAWRIGLAALAALLVGALLLKGITKDGPRDPRASADNGAPQGLLALALLLEGRGVQVEKRRDFDEPFPEGRSLLVVPPPEGSAWREREVSAVLERVREGDVDVMVLCDEADVRTARLSAWLDALELRCAALEGEEKRGRGTLPRYAAELFVRGGGRVELAEERSGVPAWIDDEGDAVVVRERVGAGAVTVVGSTTVVSNDGVAAEDNAGFFLSLVPEGARVVFDEAHHTVRSAAVLDEAFSGTGPKVALVALLLLVPAVLLGFAPRRGDPPAELPADTFLAARTAAEALAGLYLRAGVTLPESSSTDDHPRRSHHDA